MPQVKVRNILDTITSFLQHASTVARTWTIPDKDGTVAMLDDIPSVTGFVSTSNFVTSETPSGAVNGINATFTLAFTPVAGFNFYINGLRMKLGEDYTLATNVITAITLPNTGDDILADYIK